MNYKLRLDKDLIHCLVRSLGVLYCSLLAWMVVFVVVGSMFGTCEDGPPIALFYAFAIYMFAMFAWQLWYIRSALFDVTGTCFDRIKLLFMMGVGFQEIADFQSDGAQVASAYLCDANIHEDFVNSFDGSYVAFLKPIAASLHMYGLMCMFLVISIIVVAIFYFCLMRDDDHRLSQLCTVVGMPGLFEVLKFDGAEGAGPLSRLLSVVVFEVVPQSLLGASLFGLAFETTRKDAKVKQLVALGLTAASLAKIGAEGIITGVKIQATSEPVTKISVILASLACLGAIIVMCARVYYAYMCPSHVLNIGKGCADVS